MSRRMLSCVCLTTIALATGLSAADVAERKKQLDSLIAEVWEFQLRSQPEFSTVVGDNRYNDRLSDASPAALRAYTGAERRYMERLGTIDVTGLSEQDVLNRTLLARDLQRDIESYDLKLQEAPFNQFDGAHLGLPELAQIAPFQTVHDYENYLARLRKLPVLMSQLIELARLGEKDRIVPPRRLLEKVAAQAEAIGVTGEGSPFATPVFKFPDAIPAAERARLHDAVIATIEKDVASSYRNLARFMREEYAAKGRVEDGVWALQGGDRLYRFAIRRWTTTDYSADEIHALGRQQVAAVEAQMRELAKRLGYADVKALQTAVRSDKKLFASSREQILESYRKYIGQMYTKLPELFGRLPKARLVVAPIEEFREEAAAAAEYRVGTPDGSRPGRVMVNTGDYEHRSLSNIESTAYHEGAPGHHMQIALAQELPELPPFRRHAFYSAFIEGWALYAERLGEEAGFFRDPYSQYGRLESEMLRAIRLVVDTGVHAKRWTRRQMVDYFHEHSTEDEPDVQAEVDRYIAEPGQALAYKLGQLKILELRARAQRELGAKFDLRAFHDETLGAGALPLDVLDSRITAWIRSRKPAQVTLR